MTQPNDQPTPQNGDQPVPPATPVPGWPQPGSPLPPTEPAYQQPVYPAPPPYQPPQPPYQQPAQPVYQQPVDPFHTTTNTPASAQLPPQAPDPGSPYTAPTYYPPGAAPVPAPTSAQPYSAQPYSAQPYSAQPYSAQPYPGQPGYPGYPGAPVEPPKKKRNKALIITAIALGVLLVLCGIGGVAAFLLLNQKEGKGAATAKDAAQNFLTAIYKDGDATKADSLTCKEARDKKAIENKIKEIKDQGDKLNVPSYSWDTIKVNEAEARGDTLVTIKLATKDEKISEQLLKLELVKRDGWFVCEVRKQ